MRSPQTTFRTFWSIIIIHFLAGSSYAQVCDFYDDYSDPAPWNSVYIFPGVAPCSEVAQSGTLSVTGGLVYFNTVNDGSDTRIWRDLGFSLNDDDWTANFDFTPDSIGPDGTAATGHVIFALTAGDNCPWNDSIYHCELSDQDGITVWYQSAYYATPSTTGFYLYAKDGDVGVTSWGIDWITAGVGQTYYMTLKRIMTNYLTLEAYADPERTDFIGSIDCFEIPDNITDLHVLQHANAPWGYHKRTLTGTLDNTCIYNNETETAYITGPDTVCIGGTALFTVSYAGADFTWDLPPEVTYTTIGDAEIEVTDWGGLTEALITVTVNSACAPYTVDQSVAILDAITYSDSLDICNGDTLFVLGMEIFESGTYSQTYVTAAGCDSVVEYIVSVVDTLITSESMDICDGDTVIVFGEAISDAGTYSGNFISVGGCDSIHYVHINVLEPVYTTEEITICEGESAIIFGNEEFDSGTYEQTFTSAEGCDSTHSISLIVQPIPDVYFEYDSLEVPIEGLELDPGYSGDIEAYAWSPNTGLSCTDCPNPIVIPIESGWVFIEVTDANGCTDIDSIYLSPNFSPDIDVPNAFSPNGDGINDLFNVLSNGQCDLDDFQIYNRWGQVIFETKDINIGWDGTYLHVDQEIGTYVYVVYAHCDSENIFLKGTVTLVR
ncbi:MAG: gliding motility-associated C-terminal domain-containing protein [Chitinophagales bacterium]